MRSLFARLLFWMSKHPRGVKYVSMALGLGLMVIAYTAAVNRWSVISEGTYFYVLGVLLYTIYRNRKLEKRNAYLEDRLDRIEPRPIVVLDGEGRDISHLNDEVPAKVCAD